MKQNKLFTLACFSLLSLSGLASCSGSGNIPQKVDCYFRAQAATINEYGERVKVDFKDDECATMEVVDKDHLKYGEQDVVIHIKPKPFFTFKNYDTVSWEPVGGAFHPYVGLGNPHSLYNYPLQENVAWTFEDLSTGAFKEEYRITVKKEFFQKNIVIDYGNAGSLKNNVLIYNSSYYATRFKNALSPEQQVYYELDPKYSSFLAGSDGLTITYTFSKKNNLFTFAGWDQPKKPTEEGELCEYPHFKVYATTKDSNTAKNIATYDPNVEKSKQMFIPTILDDKISFFINWKILAKENKEYDPLYENIKVEFIGDDPNSCMPSVRTKVNVTSTGASASEVKFYACDYVQRLSNEVKELSTSSVSKYEEDEATGYKKDLVLDYIDVFQRKERSKPLTTDYATLFEIPENVEEFNCKFSSPSGDMTLHVKPNEEIGYSESYVDHSYFGTNWRTKEYESDNETELRCWTLRDPTSGADTWFLVQLNPTYEEAGRTITRSNVHLPQKFAGKNNLFYLFANTQDNKASPFYNNKSEKGGYFEWYNIEIDVPEALHATAFLNEESAKYGYFSQQGDMAYNVKIGVNTVDIPFYCGIDYTNKNFSVDVSTKGYGADYIPTYLTGKDYAIIRVNTPGTPFAKDEKFAITLTPAENKIVITDRKLGGFLVGGKVVYEIKTPTPNVPLAFDFKIDDDYPEILRIDYCFDGLEGPCAFTVDTSDHSILHVTVEGIQFDENPGSLLTITPICACAKIANDSTEYGTFFEGKSYKAIYEIGGSETSVEFYPTEDHKEDRFEITVESKVGPESAPKALYSVSWDEQGNPSYRIVIYYDQYEQPDMVIANGEIFTIHLNIAG